MKKENAELTGKLKRMELEQKAAAKLAEKKLPVGLSEFLDYTDEARMAASLEKIGAMYQEQLETGIKERLKGTTPKGLGRAASLTDGMISAEIQKRIRGDYKMANTIEYAKIFQPELDAAAVEQATSGWMEVNRDLVRYSGGDEVKIPNVVMDGLADYDRANGFVQAAWTFRGRP